MERWWVVPDLPARQVLQSSQLPASFRLGNEPINEISVVRATRRRRALHRRHAPVTHSHFTLTVTDVMQVSEELHTRCSSQVIKNRDR